MRLRGAFRPGDGEHNIVPVSKGDDGRFAPLGDVGFMGEMTPIPDSVVQMPTSYAWNLIANEPDFRAVTSVAERAGLEEKELLIEDRTSGEWCSLLIPAAIVRSLCLADGLLAKSPMLILRQTMRDV